MNKIYLDGSTVVVQLGTEPAQYLNRRFIRIKLSDGVFYVYYSAVQQILNLGTYQDITDDSNTDFTSIEEVIEYLSRFIYDIGSSNTSGSSTYGTSYPTTPLEGDWVFILKPDGFLYYERYESGAWITYKSTKPILYEEIAATEVVYTLPITNDVITVVQTPILQPGTYSVVGTLSTAGTVGTFPIIASLYLPEANMNVNNSEASLTHSENFRRRTCTLNSLVTLTTPTSIALRAYNSDTTEVAYIHSNNNGYTKLSYIKIN